MMVSHLQYADETKFIGETAIKNLWPIKSILRWFDLVSSLEVKFLKISLNWVNIEDSFMATTKRFLHCRVGSAPFKYLGLTNGANPR